MTEIQLSEVVRLKLKKCEALEDLHEVLIERDIGLVNGDWHKTQMFFTSEQLSKLQIAIMDYNVEILNF